MDRQQETQDIRQWLESMKGNWDWICKKTELSKKTLTLIVNSPEHLAQPSTIKALKSARKSWEMKKK